MRRGLVLLAIGLATAGCGGHRTAAPPQKVQSRQWMAVVNDWLAHGKVAQPHSCGAVVIALGHLSTWHTGYSTVNGDLGRYAGTVCTHHPKLDAVKVGMTDAAVANTAGLPRTLGPHCWLYPDTVDHTGRRVCFTNGRAAIVQISVHG